MEEEDKEGTMDLKKLLPKDISALIESKAT